MAVKVYYQKEGFRLRESRALKNWILNIVVNEGYGYDVITYVFTDDRMILQLNREFLEHDYLTDVITFDMSEEAGTVKAEIYISVDTVKRNAKHLGADFRSEMARVMAHGILHLTGYDDSDDLSSGMMREREEYYLKRYFDEA
ncbi:MAG: rRNA maturation RNase YbeY [Bacteroidales bacterium]|nr:rRNA maturation RNase YbeY [Bacteroidales bacterium]